VEYRVDHIPVSVPGAMENWGLVTYRETALLIDPQNSSSKAKQWVALVVGHELAHQWFGNLVTMVTLLSLSTIRGRGRAKWPKAAQSSHFFMFIFYLFYINLIASFLT